MNQCVARNCACERLDSAARSSLLQMVKSRAYLKCAFVTLVVGLGVAPVSGMEIPGAARAQYRETLLFSPKSLRIGCLLRLTAEDAWRGILPAIALASDSTMWLTSYSSTCAKHIRRDGHELGTLSAPPGYSLDNIVVDGDGYLWVKYLEQYKLYRYDQDGQLISEYDLPERFATYSSCDIFVHNKLLFLTTTKPWEQLAYCLSWNGQLQSAYLGRYADDICINPAPQLWAASGGLYRFQADSTWCERQQFNVTDSMSNLIFKKLDTSFVGADFLGTDKAGNLYVSYLNPSLEEDPSDLIIKYFRTGGEGPKIKTRLVLQGSSLSCTKIAGDGTIYLLSDDSPDHQWSVYEYSEVRPKK